MTAARTTFWHGNAQETRRLLRDFRRKLGRIAARLPFAADLLAAYYCAFDRETPVHAKGILLAAIAYFVLPGDALPDVMPVLGFTDDAAVLAAALRTVAENITPLHREVARDKLANLAGE